MVIGSIIVVLLGLMTAVYAPSASAAGPCGPPVTSVIACENSLPGTAPSAWQVSGVGDTTIQGFATSMSVNVGDTVNFKISTPASSYHLDILRIGYYQGNGARKIVGNLAPTATLPQTQPACLNGATGTGLIDCGNWAVSASWAVPTTAVSGLYIAHLVRNDTGGASNIPFVVRNDASHSDIVVQTSDETWQAYNTWTGVPNTSNSLYTCSINCPSGAPTAYKGASKVSYNRPWHTALDDSGRSWFMYAEYDQIRFLERERVRRQLHERARRRDQTVAPAQPQDLPLLRPRRVLDGAAARERRGSPRRGREPGVLQRQRGVLEDPTGTQRRPLEHAQPDAGVPTRRRTTTPPSTRRTRRRGPARWMDPRFSPPADGGRPQNGLTGQLFDVNSGTTDITVPASYAKLRFWRNTRVASLNGNQSTTLDPGVGTLGYEWDVDADNGFRPAGLMDMSSTTSNAAEIFTDFGGTTQVNSTATHHLTLYRAASGALVFGAGTVQWAWGLDNGGSTSATDTAMQQATVNLFADMGNVQPASLMAGLTAATPSTDAAAPTSTITSPAQNANLSNGSAVTISGSATDAGGGVVAGVEVSTDGGTTWHPVTTMSTPNTSVTWSYSWVAHGSPSTKIKSRAVDDSGEHRDPVRRHHGEHGLPLLDLGTCRRPEDAGLR